MDRDPIMINVVVWGKGINSECTAEALRAQRLRRDY
jgi:hypothetical protein